MFVLVCSGSSDGWCVCGAHVCNIYSEFCASDGRNPLLVGEVGLASRQNLTLCFPKGLCGPIVLCNVVPLPRVRAFGVRF